MPADWRDMAVGIAAWLLLTALAVVGHATLF